MPQLQAVVHQKASFFFSDSVGAGSVYVILIAFFCPVLLLSLKLSCSPSTQFFYFMSFFLTVITLVTDPDEAGA